MSTITITTEAERNNLAESGDVGWGALVRDGNGLFWIAFDTEDGLNAIRPLNEDDDLARRAPVRADLCDLELPLYVTTEDSA